MKETSGFYLTTAAITCLDCRRVSYSTHDREHRWCALCSRHHPDREARVSPGALALRRFEGDRMGVVYALSYGTARLLLSSSEEFSVGIASDEYHFAGPLFAINALRRWNGEGEPAGWTRHRSSGRRRPDGRADQEYVR